MANKIAPAPVKKKKKASAPDRILLVIFLITAVVFVPTTFMLFIGLMPTIVARLVDRTKERTKVLTVGFMNFAGCAPFWLQMVRDGHTLEVALNIMTQPSTVVVMYSAALAGYLIEWAMTGVFASLMVQKGQKRLEDIKNLQAELVKRWGVEVTGEIPLDAQGFPIETKE